MSIVHVISTLNIGGAENFMVQLANEQAKYRSVNVIVLRSTDTARNYANNIDSDIEVFHLKWKKKYSFRQLFQLNALIGSIAPKVVHVHLHNPFYYVFALSVFERKIRYVHTIHSSFSNWKKVLNIVNRLRFLSKNVLHVCLSKTIAKEVNSNYPKLHTAIVTNGIKSYKPTRSKEAIKSFWRSFEIYPEQGYRFLAIGNISDNKNYKLLALSFEAIAKQYPKAMCIQVGKPTDIALTNELKAIAASNLFLAGPKENAADFLAEADALIISSIEEGMPIVALEALSMGVPIITTPAGGMVDIVTNKNGLISQNFEVHSLKKTLLDFLELPTPKRDYLSKNAREAFESKYEIGITENLYKVNYGLE